MTIPLTLSSQSQSNVASCRWMVIGVLTRGNSGAMMQVAKLDDTHRVMSGNILSVK